MKSAARFYTVPPHEPFVDRLSSWIINAFDQGGMTLAQALILLPNRRACRALRDAFLRAGEGRPMLLPRIQPIGEIEEDGAALLPWLAHIESACDPLPPPAIHPMARMLALTRLVWTFESAKSGKPNIEQSARLAAQLGAFLDETAREEADLEQLRSLAPDDFALHWQETLQFLEIVLRHWPRILQARGASEPLEQRGMLLRAVAESWRRNPPAYPVIAAGSTGSIPATAQLLSVIARLPQGSVVLAGLDRDMPEPFWETLGPTHPQYGLKQLLGRAEMARADVADLPYPASQHCADFKPVTARMNLLRLAMAPPEATPGWKNMAFDAREALQGFRLIEASSTHEEARTIALLLRETLETPGKTAALVTHDRILARAVAAAMRRFGVAIDDSAGVPLACVPAACFVRLVAETASSGCAPVPLLSLLKHPLAAAHAEPAIMRRAARELELRLLRGVRLHPGLASLAAALRRDAQAPQSLIAQIERIGEAARDFLAFFEQSDVPFAHMLAAHLAFAEWLAAGESESGTERLWSGDDGAQIATFFARLGEHAHELPAIDPASYPGLLETLLAQARYRPRYGQHPRLAILSPLEARLQQFDRMILGGLNEGSWPALPQADPWMSRPMRAAFGLPPPEFAIGQSAHDFYTLCGAPETVLTRALRQDGAPATPSRWLLRLAAFIEGHDAPAARRWKNAYPYAQWSAQIDAPISMPPMTPPAPMPPVSARPRRLPVTAIEKLLRDPYMVYASHILRLRPLEALDRDPGGTDFGAVIHRALELFVAAYPAELPLDAHARLLDCGRRSFEEFMHRPAVHALWWPRFERIAAWVIAEERQRRTHGAHVYGELKGSWTFDAPAGPFTLTTRIDRLEVGPQGEIRLIDYKTGGIPSQGDVASGVACQLPLEALVARHGLLEPPLVLAGALASLEYWKLSGEHGETALLQENKKLEWNGLLERSQAMLESLIAAYDRPGMPYPVSPDPTLRPLYNDYEYLERWQEWGGL